MIRFKDINIPKPCTVDYDYLPSHKVTCCCESCEEHVYDVSEKDEAYFNNAYRITQNVYGIYYADHIQKPFLKTQRPFYYTFATKIIRVGLFFIILMSFHNTDASIKYDQRIQYEQQDDIPVIKVDFKNRPKKPTFYSISIFINDTLYKNNMSVRDGYLYMPDKTSAEDTIKVIVHHAIGNLHGKTCYSIKHQQYIFKFYEADKITVVIKYNLHLNLFQSRYGLANSW